MTTKKTTKAAKVAKYISKHPNATAAVIARATGASIAYVYNIQSAERRAAEKVVVPVKKITIIPYQQAYIPLAAPTSPDSIMGVSGAMYEPFNFAPPPQRVGFISATYDKIMRWFK